LYQRIISPPVASRVVPVMKEAASDARKVTIEAISSGSAMRLSGIRER
jgi:hypothetical protein